METDASPHARTFHDEPGPDLLDSFDTVRASEPEGPGAFRALTDRVRGMRASTGHGLARPGA